jgi:hypothetical protein
MLGWNLDKWLAPICEPRRQNRPRAATHSAGLFFWTDAKGNFHFARGSSVIPGQLLADRRPPGEVIGFTSELAGNGAIDPAILPHGGTKMVWQAA